MNQLHVKFAARAIFLVLLFNSGTHSLYFPLQFVPAIVRHLLHQLGDLLRRNAALVNSAAFLLHERTRKTLLFKSLVDSHLLVTLYFLEQAYLLIFAIDVEVRDCPIKVLIGITTLNFVTIIAFSSR